MKFQCFDDCADCCIWRGYYCPPNSIKLNLTTGKYEGADYKILGKRGVELEPTKIPRLKKLIKKLGKRVDESGKLIEYTILPCVGLGEKDSKQPKSIETYQLMGRTKEGDICPFLSTMNENLRTDAGSLKCLIYENRPLICQCYPVSSVLRNEKGQQFATVDLGCKWVTHNFQKWMAEPFPRYEIVGLNYDGIIKKQTKFRKGVDETKTLWLYATGVHNHDDPEPPCIGWVNWGWW